MPHINWLIPYFRICMQCTPDILHAILHTSFKRPASITDDQFDFYGRVVFPILAEANALSFTLLTNEPEFEYRRVPKPLIEVYSKQGSVPECFTMYIRMNFWGESETYRLEVFDRQYLFRVSIRTQTSGSNSEREFLTLSVPFALTLSVPFAMSFAACAKNLRILGEVDQLMAMSNPGGARFLNGWGFQNSSILKIVNLHHLCLTDWKRSINFFLYPRPAMNGSDGGDTAFNTPEEFLATLAKKLIEFKSIRKTAINIDSCNYFASKPKSINEF